MGARIISTERIGLAKGGVDKYGDNPSMTTYGQAIISHQVDGSWYQYVAYYGVDGNVRAVRRGPNGTETITLPVPLLHYDSHNILSWGISGDGRLHLVAGEHNAPMRYMVTAVGVADNLPPWSATLFSAPVGTLGGTVIGNDLSYPTFTLKPNGDLLFWCRLGRSGDGRVHLAEYVNGTWTVIGQVTSSTGNWAANGATSTTRNLYFATAPVYAHGYLHLLGYWREGNTAVSKLTSMANHNVVYVYSDNDGRTWRNNAGAVVATTGTSPYINVTSSGIHVPASTYDCRNAPQIHDLAVGPNGLIGYPFDYVDSALMTTTNGFTVPGFVTTLELRLQWASCHPRWRVPPTDFPTTWAGGSWPASSIKVDGVHVFTGWPDNRVAATRCKQAFHPSTGDMTIIYPGLRVLSARAAEDYADWTLDEPSGPALGEHQIDRTRESEGIVSILALEASPDNSAAATVLVCDVELA